MRNASGSAIPRAALFAVLLVGAPWPRQSLAADSPPAAASTAAPVAGGAGAQQPAFDIQEFRVLGNHILAPTAIERAVYPFLGRNRTIDTVKQAADALEKVYKDAGYGTVFVDIPEQDVSAGIVRLKVTEGRVAEVHVRGERYFSGRQILAALPSLQTGQTPELPSLQREIADVNARSPDRTVTPVLKAGSEPGTVDVDLSVKDELPLHGSIQYDNRHTADTTPNRATAALSYDNLWQRQDSLGVQYQTAPAQPSEAEVFSANYLGHIDFAGAQAALSYIHTSSNVLALGTLGVLGKGKIYGAHWIQPLVNSATSAQSVNVGADYKDVLTSVLPNTSGSTSAGAVTAPVTYVNWSVAYSGNWWGAKHTLSATAGVNYGVRDVINYANEFENARYNADPNYFYLRAAFNGTWTLPAGFGVLQRLTAQWADSPLVNNEQFALGGLDTVRGYLEAETLGDSGAAGTLELHSPPLGARFGRTLSPLYAFVFVDGGVTTLVDPLPGQLPNVTLWSNGFGVRLDNLHGLTGTVDYATPRRNGVRTDKDNSRVEFLLRYGF